MTTTQHVGVCTDDLIYSGFGFGLASGVPPRFGVTSISNATHVTRDLNISPTQLTDAGVYLCAERRPGNNDVLDSSSAQLTVLGNVQGGPKTKLFLIVNNLAMVDGRNVCDMSKVSELCVERKKNLHISALKYSVHSLHKSSLRVIMLNLLKMHVLYPIIYSNIQ